MFKRRPLCTICIGFIIVILFATHNSYKNADCSKMPEGKSIIVRGLVADKQIKNNKLSIFVDNAVFYRNDRAERINVTDRNGIIIYIDNTDMYSMVKIGSVIEAKGIFEFFDTAMNEGAFDARKYYRIKGYCGKLVRSRLLKRTEKYNYLKEYLRMLRDKVEDYYLAYMDEEDAGILTAMVMGDKSELSEEIKELYQYAGISHVLALSGLHIASIGMGLRRILKKFGLGNTVSAVISGTVLVLYAIMTGGAASTVRALIMFILAVVGKSIGRTYDLLSAAAVSAMGLIIENPYYIYDSGYLLSFGAVIAIGCVYPVVEKIFNIGSDRIQINSKGVTDIFYNTLTKVRQGICISVSITIVTLPVMACNFMQISLYSPVLNLIIIPLMSIILFTGIGSAFLYLLGYQIVKMCLFTGNCENELNSFWNYLSASFLKITSVILKIYRSASEFFVGLKGNVLLTGYPQKWQIIFYALMMIIAMEGFSIFCVGSEKERSDLIKQTPQIKIHMSTAVKKALTIIVMLLAVLTLIYRRYDILEVRNIYVGQGDSSLLCGRNIPTIMIDGGSTDTKKVGKYRIIPVLKANKISNIDYCFLTHMDEDHINGVFEILEDEMCGIGIKNVVVSESYLKWAQNNMGNVTDNYYERLMKAKEEGRCRVLAVKNGDYIYKKDMILKCLSPDASDEYVGNDSSIVLQITMNVNENIFSMLFTGDISAECERKLINNGSIDIFENDKTIRYLKLAHHGSRYSTSMDLLNCFKPDISVISAGINNSYGHPHKETIERLDKYANSTRVLRTDEAGQITVIVGKNVRVNQFMERKHNDK